MTPNAAMTSFDARLARTSQPPVQTKAMSRPSLPPQPAQPQPPQQSPLPPRLADALAAFERHIRAERSLSPHTVRAYVGDVRSLLEHASRGGVEAPDGLGLTHLRGWLAVQHTSGAARTTLARRGAAARTFTAFAHRRGWLAADPGPQLGTLKTRRALPHVLRKDEMRAVLTGLDEAAATKQQAQRPLPARRPQHQPKRRSPSATPPCSSCSTRPASGSASCAGWTRVTSTTPAGRSGSGARGTRNAPYRWACPRSAR